MALKSVDLTLSQMQKGVLVFATMPYHVVFTGRANHQEALSGNFQNKGAH